MAKKKVAKRKYNTTEKKLKIALHYSLGLLVNILILWLLIKTFSFAFNFSYDVFSDSAKTPSSTQTVVVKLLPDSSTKEMAKTIYDSGVIENEYVLLAKMKIGGYGGKIVSGSYELSPSMSYDEILNIISGVSTEEDEK